MALFKKTAHGTRNNLIGLGTACSIEVLDRTSTRFDFTMQWTGVDGAVNLAGFSNNVALVQDPDINLANGSPAWVFGSSDPTVCPIWLDWSVGTMPGTIKESYYNYSTLITERDNVDPGFGDIHIQDSDPPDEGRRGPRYTFMLSGTEYRVYVNYQSGFAQQAVCIVASPSTGFPFPLVLGMKVTTGMAVRNVIAGAGTIPTTIYSLRDQIADFTAAQTKLYLRIYQKGKYPGIDGIPTDIETPTIA